MNKENFGTRFKKYWKQYIIAMLICVAIGGVIFSLVYFLNNRSDIALSNGLTLAGGVLMAIGAMMWISKQGFFDFVSYGFKQMGASLFNRQNPIKYDDLPTYKQEQNKKRNSSPDFWFPVLVTGLLILIPAIILTVMFNSAY